ncbi:MAG: glycosyltransferase family 4 protein [Desulfuromonadaceae bacterium]
MTERSLQGKRVLLLFPHLVIAGGALNYVLKLAELLRRRGATVGLLTLRVDAGRYGAALADLEVLTVEGPLSSSLFYWLLLPYWQWRFHRHIDAWRPHVLVPQVFPANWWAWLYKRRQPQLPVVWMCQEPSAFIHSRNWIEALRPPWKRWLAEMLSPVLARLDVRLSRYSDKIVGNSRFTAGMIERVYGRAADAVAYPAIDFKLFFSAEGVVKEDLIVTVAKLSRFKRVDFLLRVFARLLRQQPALSYHIVGRGEEEDSLRRLAAELRIAERVVFHGALDNEQLAALQRRAKLFLHGSIEEPFGMAPLEAIACNTPVVAHRSGGPLEFVNPSCGRLIDSLEVDCWAEEIAAFLKQLAAEPGYFAGVSANARAFSWEATLSPLLQLIAEAAVPAGD